jgi:hypothetical protein
MAEPTSPSRNNPKSETNRNPSFDKNRIPGSAENRFRDEGIEDPSIGQIDDIPSVKHGRAEGEKLDKNLENDQQKTQNKYPESGNISGRPL